MRWLGLQYQEHNKSWLPVPRKLDVRYQEQRKLYFYSVGNTRKLGLQYHENKKIVGL
jgi:hypothetical protein